MQQRKKTEEKEEEGEFEPLPPISDTDRRGGGDLFPPFRSTRLLRFFLLNISPKRGTFFSCDTLQGVHQYCSDFCPLRPRNKNLVPPLQQPRSDPN